MKRLLMIAILTGLLSGCGEVTPTEVPDMVFSRYRAVEVTEEQEKENEMLESSIEEYRKEQEEKAVEAFEKEDHTLTIQQTLFADVSEEELEEELFYDQLEEVAVCATAEAQNQGYKGMYLVACVIFNRVKHPDYPDTIHGVIAQKNQFASYSDGGMEKWNVPSEECYKAVWDAYTDNRYPDLVYFCEGSYSKHGTPAFKYKDHYFSAE